MVLTDISMPVMDGLELRKNIGVLFPQLPVIAVTGNAMPADLDYYRTNGFAGTLSKPFRRDELLSFVADTICRAFGPLSGKTA